MYNWSTDETELKKDKKRYDVWRLEQSINFGLNGQKISKKTLIGYWNKLSIDPTRKAFLKLILHD